MKYLKTKNDNEIRLFNTFDDLTHLKNAVFLAGGTLRQPYLGDKTSWRKEAINLLLENNYIGDIIVPEWESDTKPTGWEYNKQVEWELEGLYKSSKILFWIPRDMTDLPCLTTNIEFGNFIDNNKIFCGGNNVKNEYIKYRLEKNNKEFYTSLQDLIIKVCEINKSNIWFTSDTHFSQERTRELSKRPFKDVKDMDLTLINNWNSLISPHDTVYFLGDFGNVDILKCLNFEKMYFLVGNYERNNDEILLKLKQDTRITLIYSDTHLIKCYDELYMICHEPQNRKGEIFNLFGHVHQLSMIKKNSLNVGIDTHRFLPINIQTVKFYKNAIQNFYDENVFIN